MPIRTRFTAAIATILALLASVFVSAPAHASAGGDLDTLAPFDRAGEGVHVVAIAVVMVVLLLVVLGLAQLISSAFKAKN